MNLTQDPIGGLLAKVAVPAAVGMLLQVFLNITDTWFAGLVSTQAQAALSLSFPMFFILNTFGAGLGTGASALIGRSLGAGDVDEARRLAGQAVFLALGVGLALIAVGHAAAKPLFVFLKAEGAYLDMCLAYMHTIFAFAPAFMLLNVFNSFLTAQGDSRSMRNALAAGVIVNAVLDYWFLFGGLGLPALGLAGLALATGLCYVFSVTYLIYKALKTPLLSAGLSPSLLKPHWPRQLELWRQAVPAGLNTASVGVGIYIINWFVSQFGPPAVAAYGVAVRVEQLALLPALGLSLAVLPLTAQNDGAGLTERVNQVRAMAVKYGLLLALAGFVPLFFFGHHLMGLLSTDQQVMSIGALYLKFDGSILFAYVLLFTNVSHLQGRKKPMFALWMGLYRQIAAPLAVFWLLVFKCGLGLWGLWLGIVLVTVSGALFSEWYVRRQKP